MLKRLGQISAPVLSALALTGLLSGWVPKPGLAQTSPPTASQVLPAELPGVLLLNTKPEAWAELNQFGLFPENFQIQPSALIPFLLFGRDLDIEKDIQSWLGDEAAIAFLPLRPDRPKNFEDIFLVMATIRDEGQAKAFVEKLKQQQKKPPIERQYKGITILEWPAEKPPKPPTEVTPTPQAAPKPMPSTQLPPSSEPTPNLQALTTQLSPRQFMPEPPTLSEPPTLNVLDNDSVTSDGSDGSSPKPETVFNPGLTIAIVGNQLLLGGSAVPIEQTIDTQISGKSLAKNPRFQRTANHAQYGNSLLRVYGDIPQYLTLITAVNEVTQANLPPDYPFPKLGLTPDLNKYITETFDTLDAVVWVERNGLHLQSNAHFVKPFATSPVGLSGEPLYISSQNKILAELPGSTYGAANATNLASVWKEVVATLETDPDFKKKLPDYRKTMQQYVGVDDRDIFSWMDGEYAFAYFPSKGGAFNTPSFKLGVGSVFLIQTSDRPAAEATIAKLTAMAKKNVENDYFKVVTRQIKGKTVTSFEFRDGKQFYSILAYGWLTPNTLVVTSGAGEIGDLSPVANQSLAQSFTFTTAIKPLPKENSGYGYVNMGSTLAWTFNTLMPQFFTNSEPARPAGELNIRSMTRAQQAYYLELGKFASKFDDLGLGLPSNGSTHVYKIVPANNYSRRVVMTAQAKKPTERSYTAAVYLVRLGGEDTTVTIVCETSQQSNKIPGIPKLLGVANGKPQFQCAAGSQLAGTSSRPAQASKLPPEVVEVQRRLGNIRSFSGTTSMTPDRIQADAWLNITPAKKR